MLSENRIVNKGVPSGHITMEKIRMRTTNKQNENIQDLELNVHTFKRVMGSFQQRKFEEGCRQNLMQ